MPNHFDSVLTVEGSKEDIDQFVSDFVKSSVCGQRLCLCQFADPVPEILYKIINGECRDLDRLVHMERRLLTEEEKQEIRKFGYMSVFDYAREWWGTKYGCYDTSLKRVLPTKVVYRFWTPLVPVGERILLLLHTRYPNLVFHFEGQDEMNPGFHVEVTIDQNIPLLSKEEIDEKWKIVQEKKRMQTVAALRSMFNIH